MATNKQPKDYAASKRRHTLALVSALGVKQPTAKRVGELESIAGNWIYAHNLLAELYEGDPAEAIHTAAELLYIELDRPEPREHMVTRVYGKLLFMRRDWEKQLLDAIVRDQTRINRQELKAARAA
jgi:hypothetical protein